jgi:hypothetical protein
MSRHHRWGVREKRKLTEAERFLKERDLDVEEMRKSFLDRVVRRPTESNLTAYLTGRDMMSNSIKELRAREEYIPKFGFAILGSRDVEQLRRFAPLLEVGAGSGYWAYELRKAGIEVVATDPNTERFHHGHGEPVGWDNKWTEVLPLNALEAVQQYPHHNLLMVWPSLGGDWAAEAVEHHKGEYVLYVGEGDGGCTGNDRLHGILEGQFEEAGMIEIPQFWGLHDRLWIYHRTNEAKR